jgi:hypothetical protein
MEDKMHGKRLSPRQFASSRMKAINRNIRPLFAGKDTSTRRQARISLHPDRSYRFWARLAR